MCFRPDTTCFFPIIQAVRSKLISSRWLYVHSRAYPKTRKLLEGILAHSRVRITKAIIVDPAPLQQELYENDGKLWQLTLFELVEEVLNRDRRVRVMKVAHFVSSPTTVDIKILDELDISFIDPRKEGFEDETKALIDEETLLYMPFVENDLIGFFLDGTKPGMVVMTDPAMITARLRDQYRVELHKYEEAVREFQVTNEEGMLDVYQRQHEIYIAKLESENDEGMEVDEIECLNQLERQLDSVDLRCLEVDAQSAEEARRHLRAAKAVKDKYEAVLLPCLDAGPYIALERLWIFWRSHFTNCTTCGKIWRQSLECDRCKTHLSRIRRQTHTGGPPLCQQRWDWNTRISHTHVRA